MNPYEKLRRQQTLLPLKNQLGIFSFYQSERERKPSRKSLQYCVSFDATFPDPAFSQ